MKDGRELSPAASLQTHGFSLHASWPSSCNDFRDDEQLKSVYYEEMRELVAKEAMLPLLGAAPASSRVFVFDHTLRESGKSNLNATGTSLVLI